MSLAGLPGIGPSRRASLEKAGLATARDLVFWLPRAHLDRSRLTRIADVAEGEHTIRATVTSLKTPRFRRRVPYAEANLEDESGSIRAIWFGRFDVKHRLAPGVEVLLSGSVRRSTGKRPGLRFNNPDFEELDADFEAIATGGIIPVYPVVPGVGQATLRRAIRQAVESEAASLKEYLDGDWMPVAEAVREIHMPSGPETLARARARFVYEEFFLYELAMAARKAAAARDPAGGAIDVPADIDRRIRARLPFKLTGAQERAVAEIRADLASGRPMSRLLQGDVGSGKTAVAFYAMLSAVAAKGQAVLLAPTETLAEQHYRTITGWLSGSKTLSLLLTGSLRTEARRKALAALASGQAHIAVGTHALFEPDVAFADLRLAVVDEQHRFGVLQRAALVQKGRRAHVLAMTATPIPRTLALTAFGDLDVSTLDELPPGRTPVTTTVVDVAAMEPTWLAVRAQISAGRQAFIVFPLVDGSDKIAARSAIEMHETISRHVFPDLKVGLLHGRMKPEEKADAMTLFRSGKTNILVSTVVIEVGVDVPNATIMIVGNAERFGLAQLHQLRGRIGRSSHASACILAAGDKTPEAVKRLKVLESTQDGFKIAEADLRMRGPGEFLGTRQSGAPEFHLANLVDDVEVLLKARDAAFAIVKQSPDLKKAPRLRSELKRRLGERMGLAGVI